MSINTFTPTPADKFTFGLWTLGNTGRDPFGEPTRSPLTPAQIVDAIGQAGGAFGVNFHDNDLIPLDASDQASAQIKSDFRKALRRNKLKIPMATTNLFSDPVFKDGAFTSNDADIRAYAIQKTMRAMQLGAEFGAKIYVMWGGREGTESDATKDPILAVKRYRKAINFLCKYNLDQNFGFKFALEAKANEPRGHIYFAVTGSYLGFIETLDHPKMVGVNPEFAHENMVGLNFVHHVAQAIEHKKLFHIDLNDQVMCRYDQDFRFASNSYKQAFFLVKLLTDTQYRGFKHFDSHAYRQSDHQDVIEFAKGSMRSYKILEYKTDQFNKDKQIQKLVKLINRDNRKLTSLTNKFTKKNAAQLLATNFNRHKLAERRLPYEELDQLTFDLLMGVR
ncbi:Xylose isomerase [Poriferisphaera corsica]|uniref:Xylose isomerase n=1 Tax=Poriferisphaera corsica TaxID=2528020 RepID=A0A517YXB0_9BACT|nr:xylose isomerase [Poriferisphaera corsica]QDU34864.1 Xylose isomerase [Poriferisphaera corsica]